jgi:hypothetical protein
MQAPGGAPRVSLRSTAWEPSIIGMVGLTEALGRLPLVGHNGLTRKYPLERHDRDALCLWVHGSVLAGAGRAALASVSKEIP